MPIKRSVHLLFVLLSVYLFSGGGFLLQAKPRSVYLDKELQRASFIENVEITGYTDSTVLFKVVSSGISGFAKVTRGPSDTPGLSYSTGYWPAVSERVLIVVDSANMVSLFAIKKQASIYRFWSPLNTGSTAMFFFKSPAFKLPENNGLGGVSTEYETCWDGCLLREKDIKKIRTAPK